MSEFLYDGGMVPYQVIFPKSNVPFMTTRLARRLGKAKAGAYAFIEAYCVEPGCDCRRAVIHVVNEQGREMAVIEFGFDPEGTLAGPYLSEFAEQSKAALDLLELFVEGVNGQPDWLQGMYRRYRAVRKKVDGHPYRGRPFPKPGMVMRTATPCPALAGEDPHDSRPEAAETRPSSMADFVEAYRQLADGGGLDAHRFLQDGLRRYLLDHKTAGRELAVLLTQLAAATPAGEERIDAALRVLFDALEILRVELERGRSGARQRMLRWQTALARHVFREGGDGDLCAAVSHVLLQNRIEILPVLLDAHSERMMAARDEMPMDDLSEEAVMAGLYGSLEELGLDSPFELLQAFQQLVGVAPAELQLTLCGELLVADNPLIRDMAALMLFHPRSEVRKGAARQLAELPGERITSDTLRRLIVARNWFPEAVRRPIDQAVANARRARVACAPLPDSPAMTVFATVVDGAGAQSFQVMVPDGPGFVSCSILLKQGVGVADAFELPFATKRELKDFQAMLQQEVQACRSSADYLDRRVCQALAEGARLGNVPDPWLVAIAERLGRDQWRAIPGDPRQELAALREELENAESPFLTARRLRKALTDSAAWPASKHFASSWFEDDATVDRTVEKALGKGKRGFDERKVVSALIEQVLEPRREIWLERLVLTTLWLKSCSRPPLPWQQLFLVAEALADRELPLADIPLMRTVAEHSFGACVARREEQA